jgi:hypothetical protein
MFPEHPTISLKKPRLYMAFKLPVNRQSGWERASVAVIPGIAPTGNPAEIKTDFNERGLQFVGGFERRGDEIISPGYYRVALEDGHGGTILVEQSSSEHPYLYFGSALFMPELQHHALVISASPSRPPPILVMAAFLTSSLKQQGPLSKPMTLIT